MIGRAVPHSVIITCGAAKLNAVEAVRIDGVEIPFNRPSVTIEPNEPDIIARTASGGPAATQGVETADITIALGSLHLFVPRAIYAIEP